jgi:Kef-type K+ transport system membrane component KefB
VQHVIRLERCRRIIAGRIGAVRLCDDDELLMRQRFLIYVVILAGAVLAVAGLIYAGGAWLSPLSVEPNAPAAAPPGALAQMFDNARQPLPRLILQLIVIITSARALGALASRLGQPAVIGEIAAGVLLGPSLLGALAPAATGFLFPDASLPTLHLLSQIGVLLFMFAVGLELDPAHLRGRAQAAVAVSHFSIVIPFVLGVALSLALYTRYAPAGVPFYAFALFCGIAMSITAFPVLARILEDHRLTHTPLGATAITCAAVDDVTAWSILAVVVAITTAGGALQTLSAIVVLSGLFVAAMIFVVRPALPRVLQLARMGDTLTKSRIAVVLVVLLAAALATELIGIHALFGAFVAGAIMPLGGTLRSVLRDRIESISSVFLLPLFFVYTGLRTHVGLLDDAGSWLVCVAIIVVATSGKVGSTVLAARWTGMPWRDSVALGALMNTRGLMELVALNVGYDLGILTPEIFTMMVLMALATTAMTGPLLSFSLTWGRSRASVPNGPVHRAP